MIIHQYLDNIFALSIVKNNNIFILLTPKTRNSSSFTQTT